MQDSSKFNDFRKEILKINKSRHHDIKNSIGLKDAYKEFKKENKSVTQKEYSQIIKRVNKYLIEEFNNYHDIVFPYNMGKLELRQYDTKIEFKNGKVETNRPIDWKSTLQLWKDDIDSYNKKTLIRYESNQLFKIYYNKQKSDFQNQIYYKFIKNRKLNIL